MNRSLSFSLLIALLQSPLTGAFFFTNPPSGGGGGPSDWGKNLFAYLGGMGSGGFYATPKERNRWIDELQSEMLLEAEAYIHQKNKNRKRGERETTAKDCNLHNDDFLDFCSKRKEDREIFNNVVEVAAIFETAIEKQEKDLDTKRRMYEDALKQNKFTLERVEGKKAYKKMIRSADEEQVKAKILESKHWSEKRDKLKRALKSGGVVIKEKSSIF